MSLQLNQPKQAKTLDRVRITALKVEQNVCAGQLWVEFWLCLGYQAVPGDDNTFVQQIDPDTGNDVYSYLKIENGMNPFRSGMMLGKCDSCGKWFPLVGGPCDDCSGTIQPYDGWTRLVFMPVSAGGSIYTVIRDNAYNFFCNEEVPDPDTWELRKLLDAQ